MEKLIYERKKVPEMKGGEIRASASLCANSCMPCFVDRLVNYGNLQMILKCLIVSDEIDVEK